MNIPLKQYWELLANHIKPQKGRFSLLTVLLLGSIGLQVVNPQIVRTFIDSASSGAATSTLAVAALAFMGIALFQQVVAVSATFPTSAMAPSASVPLSVPVTTG